MAAGLKMPLMNSVYSICSALLGVDFSHGRTLENLGLKGMSKEEILKYLA